MSPWTSKGIHCCETAIYAIQVCAIQVYAVQVFRWTVCNTGGQLEGGSQRAKPTDLLLLCEQSADHQVALLSAAMQTGNPFLPVVAASFQVGLSLVKVSLLKDRF